MNCRLNSNVNEPIGINMSRNKRPSFAAVSEANEYAVGRDLDTTAILSFYCRPADQTIKGCTQHMNCISQTRV